MDDIATQASEAPPYSITVRLPTRTEYWYAARYPSVGETIVRAGTEYTVSRCEVVGRQRVVVTLEPENSAAEPSVVPS